MDYSYFIWLYFIWNLIMITFIVADNNSKRLQYTKAEKLGPIPKEYLICLFFGIFIFLYSLLPTKVMED